MPGSDVSTTGWLLPEHQHRVPYNLAVFELWALEARTRAGYLYNLTRAIACTRGSIRIALSRPRPEGLRIIA